MDFADQADHRIKIKETEKRAKYLDLGGELKMLQNMKVMVKGPQNFGVCWKSCKLEDEPRTPKHC